MKPRRHRARGRAAIVFPARGKKGKFGAIFLVLGLRRGWGGAFRGYRPASGVAIKSVRPVRAAAPLQKFCAALIWHWRPHGRRGHIGAVKLLLARSIAKKHPLQQITQS
eukprot:COSAG02_NODE_2022_length_10084_cov_2.725643_3_plen_109_part_00